MPRKFFVPAVVVVAGVLMSLSACGAVSDAISPPSTRHELLANAQTSPTEKARIERFLSRLDAMSAAAAMKREGVDPSRIVLGTTIAADGTIVSKSTPSIAFRFRPMPWTKQTPGGPEKIVVLAAALSDDEARTLVVALRQTGAQMNLTQTDAPNDGPVAPEDRTKTSLERVQVMVARERAAAPSGAGRVLAAKLWRLIGENVNAPYAPAALGAVVLGTRLVRDEASGIFSKPGTGSWTLLRIAEPGDAYLAIDWNEGKGEFFPKVLGERSETGAALFRAF